MNEDMHPDQTTIYDVLGIEPMEEVRPVLPPPPKLRLITKAGEQLVLARGHQTLVEDPDGLHSRVVHPHSRRKASIVGKYARMVATGMKFHWPGKLWWVEFYAGPGRLFEDESREFLPGSPLTALSVKDPFTGYVFVDLDPLCVESLTRRTSGMGSNVFVMQGDANAPDTLDRIASIVPQDALVVMYADPEGLDFDLDTVRHFTARYRHMDWLINFPGPGIARYLSAGYEQRAIRVLDDPNPSRFLANARPKTYGVTLRVVYQRQLEGLGFRTRSEPVYLSNGAVIYDVFLATQHDRALDFFDKACGIKLGQTALFDPSVG